VSKFPRTVILFGASGFIGRHILDALRQQDIRIIGVTASGAALEGCESVVSMDRLDSISTELGDTVVVNVAAHRYVAGSFSADQSRILETNVRLATTVYRFCAERGIREVRQASSVAVYPADWDVLDDERAFNLDDWPNASETGYAWSKRWAEICGDIHRKTHGIQTVTFRLTNPYGPYDACDLAAAHVAPAFVIKALRPESVFEILGNPDAQRDFIFARDAANVFRQSLRSRGLHDAFNLAAGQTTSIRELAEASLRASGIPKQIVVRDPTPSGVAVRRATARKLRRIYDLPAFKTLDEGLTETAEWYRHELAL
jgi:nucleoside-diphosphate-sugar epimerase